MSFDLVTSTVDRPCAMPMGGCVPIETIEEADRYATGQPQHLEVSRAIVARTMLGHQIWEARREAQQIANDMGQPVLWIFNGKSELIRPEE